MQADSISRFPYSGWGIRRSEPTEDVGLSAAEIAQREADFIARWTAALPNARAWLAGEADRIIAASAKAEGR